MERKIGRGHVLMTAFAPTLGDSNLPTRMCFVPLVHETVYYLAAPSMVDANIAPGAEAVVRLRPRPGKSPPADAPRRAVVTAPSGRKGTASLRWAGGALSVRLDDAAEPGVYRVELPKSLAGIYPAAASRAGAADVLLVVVLGDPNESRLRLLTDGDLDRVGRRVKLIRVRTLDEMLGALGAGGPGRRP